MNSKSEEAHRVLTPDQRLRVFISSAMQELAPERAAAQAAIETVQLTPVLFELGARPHPPRTLYQAYLEQSHIFIGIYWQSYGWVAPDLDISGVEDEFRHSGGVPRLLYVKEPAPQREPRLDELLRAFRTEASFSYKKFANAKDLQELIPRDLALLISERFAAAGDAPVKATATVPAPRTSFVGRAAELVHLQELLSRDEVRLVTVSGPGGIGKTRLAVEGARRFADRYPGGVVFVPLESIGDASLVAAAIAAAIGIRDVGNELPAAIIAHVRTRSMLLVLDNFEHVIGAAPLVISMLDAAPGLKVIVTSRELLRLRGENELPVPPLSAEQDAVTLFCERAAAASHSFEVAAEDLSVVAEICRRLDGVPLAIELAAPRIRLLTPLQLLKRLTEHLALAGLRDAPARQQTLCAAIDWSYQLLSAEERQLFDQLGAFCCSFTIESAQSVCELPPEADVLQVLAALLDKSMIYRLPEGGGTRFAMLGMIREYALNRLAETGELDAVFARLNDFYLRSSRTSLHSINRRGRKRLVKAEVDNARVGRCWLAEHSVADLRCCAAGGCDPGSADNSTNGKAGRNADSGGPNEQLQVGIRCSA